MLFWGNAIPKYSKRIQSSFTTFGVKVVRWTCITH